MRPLAIAFFLLLHALAHAGAGTWAAGRASPWIVTPLWLGSMGGFLLASFALFGVERLRRRAEIVTFIATMASALLLRLAGIGLWSLLGLAIGLMFCALVRWWARCAHPEIRTPTFTTGEFAVIPERVPLSHQLGAGFAYLMLAVTATLIVTRPFHMSWGTTPGERLAVVPGMAFEEPPHYRLDHGVTVHAPAERVWPWLAQIGQDRAGFYSYDWLERAFGDDIHNVDSLVPSWQHRAEGELVRATQPDYLGGRFGSELGWRISHWDPPRSLTLENWGSFVVAPVDSVTSRLLVHTRGPGRPTLAALPLAALGFYLLEPAHFIMERGMLLGIKSRAERATPSAR